MWCLHLISISLHLDTNCHCFAAQLSGPNSALIYIYYSDNVMLTNIGLNDIHRRGIMISSKYNQGVLSINNLYVAHMKPSLFLFSLYTQTFGTPWKLSSPPLLISGTTRCI
jgi:hypothetical protein